MPLTTVSPGMLDTTAQYYSFKNRIINGGMNFWQRGTSFTNVATTNNYYTADRWGANRNSDASGLTVSRSTDVPAGFKYSAKFQREAGNAATNALAIFNSNESINTLDFAGQSVTLSFYAKVGANWSASNDISVSIRSGTGTDQRVYQFTGLVSQSSTVTITDSWAKYSITKTVPANATEVGAVIQSGAYSGTAGADDSLYITGVQLEKGSTATSFDYRPYGTELALCQRYFEKSVSQGTAIQTSAQATFYGNMQSSIANGIWYLTIPFKVIKRAAPTVTTYPYTTATNTGRFSSNVGTDYGANSAAAGGIYDSQFNVQNNSGGTLSIGSGIVFGSWFASAEL